MDNNVINVSNQERLDLMMEKKPYAKINLIGKLHIIYSIDNGKSKIDIAREYGVHLQTITYIYRQKEMIIKKNSRKYHQLKEVDCIKIDQTLLNWLKFQISNQAPVTEENLLSKAQEMIQNLSKKFIYIDDWLLDFQLRHNIEKYTPEVQHSVESVAEWNELVNHIKKTDELYVCGTCALSHSFTIDNIAAEEVPKDYMSIFFIVHALGLNRRKIAVVGKEHLITESNIGSLPVNYYCNNGQVNYQAIINHLNDWDMELASEGKSVFLVLNMPDNGYLKKIEFGHIRIIKSNLEYLSKILDKIVECFKYNYRKLQILRKLDHDADHELYLGLLDYINMISLAWFNAPSSHVKHVFSSPHEGSLFIRPNETCDGNHSLKNWCERYNMPISLELYGHCLDQFIWCDKELKSFVIDDGSDAYKFHTDPRVPPGMEAYQAAKRLLSYVQGEGASDSVLKSAKHLENHLEYGALLEIHKIIDSNTLK